MINEPPAKPHLRKIVLAAALGAAGLAVWLLVRTEPLARQRLPDGSTLQLDAVTYGRKHRPVRLAEWQRLLGPLVNPAQHGEALGSATTPVDALLLWCTWQNRTTPTVRSEKPGSARWLGRIETRDSHGCRFDQRGWIAGDDGSMPARGMLVSFGRREPLVPVRLFESGQPAAAAEFRIPNPTPGPHPSWRPEALPREQRQGQLTVRLRGFKTGLSWQEIQSAQPPPHPRELATLQGGWSLLQRRIPDVPSWKDLEWSRASLQLPAGTGSQWRLDRVIVSDATGNRQDFLTELDLVRSVSDATGNFWVAFPAGLCSYETAWSLRFEFAYTGPKPRDRAHLRWTVPDLLVPVPGETALREAEFKESGVELRLAGLTGPGASLEEEPQAYSTEPRVHLSVTEDPYERVDLEVEAIDIEGRRHPCRRAPAASPAGEAVRAYALELPVEAMLFKLVVTGWKRRTVEFKIKPRQG